MVKFIHAADLHMDRSFEGLASLDQKTQDFLLNANLVVLENIIEVAIEHKVDFVLFAGDNFHQNRPSLKMQRHFTEQMDRLNQKGIPVYLIFGNHDFYQPERYWFDFPENVHLFKSEEVETKNLQLSSGETVALSGFSYCHPWIQKEKAAEFPSRSADYHIGIYHGELGTEGKGNYAPFTLSQMKEKNYDYWALGHIHVPSVLNSSPYIVYPGAPQGHTQKEKRSDSVLLVEIDKQHSIITPFKVSEVTWLTKEISLKQTTSTSEGLMLIEKELSQLNDSFYLAEVQIKDHQHLGRAFSEKIDSGELLEYLRDNFSNRASTLFVWRISIKEEGDFGKIPIHVSNQLVDQLFEQYRSPEDFKQVLREVYSHPEAARVITELPDFPEQTVDLAKELLAQDFLFEEAEK
jgi:exonuclease SbcD